MLGFQVAHVERVCVYRREGCWGEGVCQPSPGGRGEWEEL